MNQKVNFNGKQYYVGKLFEFLNLDIQKLKIALKRTNDIDKAFQLVLCFSGLKKEDIKARLKKMTAKEEILLQYPSITSFCVQHCIYLRAFQSILKKNPFASLKTIFQIYLDHEAFNMVRDLFHNIHHVSIGSICLEYGINYEYLLMRFRKSGDLLLAFEHTVFLSTFDKVSKFSEYQSILFHFRTMSSSEVLNFLNQNSILKEDQENFILYYKKISKIYDALNIYSIIEYLEIGWENDYQNQIKLLNEKRENWALYTESYQQLKQNARKQFLDQFSLSEEDISNYYRDFYSNFEKRNYEKDYVWCYSRKKIKI